jgi:hypothetical protein
VRTTIDRHVIPRDEPPLGHEKTAACRCRPVLITRYERVQDLAGRWWDREVLVARHRPLRVPITVR